VGAPPPPSVHVEHQEVSEWGVGVGVCIKFLKFFPRACEIVSPNCTSWLNLSNMNSSGPKSAMGIWKLPLP
jgi:hypothetical protein